MKSRIVSGQPKYLRMNGPFRFAQERARAGMLPQNSGHELICDLLGEQFYCSPFIVIFVVSV